MIIKEYIGYLDEASKEKKKQDQAIKRQQTVSKTKPRKAEKDKQQ